MDKILILGKNSRLGSSIIEELKKRKIKHISLGKDDLDLINSPANKIKKTIFKINPKIIINTTAITDVDKIETDNYFKKCAYVLNSEIPGTLAKISKDLNSVFVHFSTDFVFDGKKRAQYYEEDKPNPINEYGKTKLLGEKNIQKNYNRFYIIRTSYLWGKGNNFVDFVLERIKNKQHLNLVYDVKSKFTNTNEIAKHLIKLISNSYDFGIYHFVNEGVFSPYNLGKLILKIIKNKKDFKENIKINKIKIKNLFRPAKRPKYSALMNSKFKKMRPTKKVLKEYLKNYKI